MDMLVHASEKLGVTHAIALVVPYFLIWHVCFWVCVLVAKLWSPTYNKLDRPMKSYWAASMVSNVHAIYICWQCTLAARELDIFNSHDFWHATPRSSAAFAAFLGYLASDLMLTLFYTSKWSGYIANIIHHTIGLVCWYQLLVGGYGHMFGVSGILLEVTTPFINQRFFMDKAGQKNTTLYVINGAIVTILWFLIRICFFTWVGFRVFMFRSDLFTLRAYQVATVVLSFVGAFALQIFWFSKIVKGILKVLSQPKKSPQRKI